MNSMLNEFALLPLFYTIDRTKNVHHFPNYAYTEAILLDFEMKFAELGSKIRTFSETLFPLLLL